MADLHLTSPPLHGKNVETLQRKLATLGFSPGRLDGIYGATTAAAVRRFQKAHRLRQDGVVGVKTRAALAKAKATSSHPPRPTAAGVKALHEALKHLGTVESPRGSNRQRFGAWLGVNGVPWCAIFVSFCFKTAAGVVIGKGARGPGVYPAGCTYVPTVEAWLRSTGRWIGRSAPQAGDIAIFNWDGGVPDHIGIVERYLGGGKFVSVEGNTTVGNDSNGGEVMRRERYISQVNGFGRL